MLLTYGYEKVHRMWHVEESTSSVFLRMYWVTGGDATYHNITQPSHNFQENHLYVFPTNSPYSISHNPDNPLTCLYLHLDITPYVLSDFVDFNMEDEALLYHLCSAFLLICKEEKLDNNAPLQRNLSQSIISVLVQKGIFQTIDNRIAKSIDYITQNLSENMSIDNIGAISGYHPKYFSQIFKENIGITPHQFIIQYRMKHALMLLQENHSITETALAIGYTDVKSFSKMFYKTYGILPSKARKEYLNILLF